MNHPLKSFLATLPSGLVSNTTQLNELLADAWLTLSGADDGGMESYKIFNRTESLSWHPPYLTFTIERHGGTVNGSTRAELQDWRVDISSWSAGITSTRRRQLRPTQQRLNVSDYVRELAEAILHNRESSSLKRYPDGRVKVLIGTIIPDDGFKQTIAGRRKRFRIALEKQISVHGWLPVGINTYVHKPTV